MTAAMDRMRELLAPQAVIDAYRETGLRAIDGSWGEEDRKGHRCACAAGAVACARGTPWEFLSAEDDEDEILEVSSRLELPRELVRAFTLGFDGVVPAADWETCDEGPEVIEAHRLGEEVRQAVEQDGGIGWAE